MIKPLFWKNSRLFIVDQTQLPQHYNQIEIKDHHEMAKAIKRLAIRGAPAIGIAAAYGLVLGLKPWRHKSRTAFLSQLDSISQLLSATRPTAVNLQWALNKMKQVARSNSQDTPKELWPKLLETAHQIHREDIDNCLAIAKQGAALLPTKANLITYCNTGGLATGGLGTALGIIIKAHQQGKIKMVYVNETRPLLQGARLTTWELLQEQVPCKLCTDNMNAYLMDHTKISAVIVGADRIARNGDTANKIGTAGLAVLAHHHKIPFYIAAPTSTIDINIPSGQEIPIEKRSSKELTSVLGKQIAPQNCKTLSPAFDVTPGELISAIITEKNIHYPPFNLSTP